MTLSIEALSDPGFKRFKDEVLSAPSGRSGGTYRQIEGAHSTNSSRLRLSSTVQARAASTEWLLAANDLETPQVTPDGATGQAESVTTSEVYTGTNMTTPSREELTLQFQNARLQVDKDLLAAKQAEIEFRSEIKVMISQQGETFQTLRSDINKAVGESNLNVERLRSEMHKESSVNLRWIVSTMIAIGLATAGAVSWIVKSSIDSRLTPPAATAVSQPPPTGAVTMGTAPQSAPAKTK